MPTRVLITGGAGFLGLHLARRLSGDGAEVDLADNFARGRRDESLAELEQSGRVRVLELDLASPAPSQDSQPRRDYDFIYHFAALLGVGNVIAYPYDTLTRNVDMLRRALDIGRTQRTLGRFVFTSTSEVYAGTLEHGDLPLPTPENAPLVLPGLDLPRTSYMLSKVVGEALVLHSGLPVTIVRPHNVYGPRMGMRHVVPELMRKATLARNGESLAVHSVEHTRTFCYVDDAVEMLVAIASTPACERRTLNLGVERPEISIGELAEQIVAISGKSLEIEAAPAHPGSPSRRCPSLALLRELIGREIATPLDVGLSHTWEWYSKHALEAEDQG